MRMVTVGPPWGLEALAFADQDVPDPKPGEVLVRIQASSLNYHDYLLLSGRVRSADRFIPLADGAGEVVSVGADVSRFAVGDRVLSTFFPGWHDGPVGADKKGRIPGTHGHGFAVEYVARPEAAFTRQPEGFTMTEAATLPCAGLTAWNALNVCARITPGDWVLTQGTGAVSIFALQFAKAGGARVVATSSSDGKLERLKALGADYVINYKTEPKWGAFAKEITNGRGVDIVVDVGGGPVRESIAACRIGGSISVVGHLAGGAGEFPTVEIVLKSISISGVSVGSHASQRAMISAIEANKIKPVVDSTFPLDRIKEAFAYQQSQRHFGKIAIEI
jgi:NADPH:quinone reductase-like Zn-dependent oxidoreductase